MGPTPIPFPSLPLCFFESQPPLGTSRFVPYILPTITFNIDSASSNLFVGLQAVFSNLQKCLQKYLATREDSVTH